MLRRCAQLTCVVYVQVRDLEGLVPDDAFWELMNEGPSDDEEIIVPHGLTSKLTTACAPGVLTSSRDNLKRRHGFAVEKTSQGYRPIWATQTWPPQSHPKRRPRSNWHISDAQDTSEREL